jgi:hypothetical protein
MARHPRLAWLHAPALATLWLVVVLALVSGVDYFWSFYREVYRTTPRPEPPPEPAPPLAAKAPLE